MSDLTTRVLNAIPAGAYEMNALLSLLRIEETDAVPTASVSCERRPGAAHQSRLRAPSLPDRRAPVPARDARAPSRAAGHTRLFPRPTRAHNLAFDALINAMLVLRFPAQAYRSFFLEMYGAEQGPMRLLAPPDDHEIADPALCRLHHVLYEDGQTTSEEVFNAIHESLTGAGDDANDGSSLLGSHGDEEDDEWGTEGLVDGRFVAAIRGIVEKWPPPETPIRGRSLADALSRTDVKPASPAARVLASLRQALLGAATRRVAGAARSRALIPVQDVGAERVRSPRGCRSQYRVAAAAVLATGEVTSWARRAGRGSTSTSAEAWACYVPFLYGALAALRGYVERDVFLFSTVVEPRVPCRTFNVDVSRRPEGRYRLRPRSRAEAPGPQGALVTDGYVGPPTAEHRRRSRQSGLEIRVALTPGGWRKDLEDLGAGSTNCRVGADNRRHQESIVNEPLRFAEAVCEGHPDRLADRIAGRIVDLACGRDDHALVGVEVAIHRNIVFIDGRIAAGTGRASR